MALGKHTRADDVWRCMSSSSMESIHGRKTSSVSRYHGPWIAHMVGLRRPWQVVVSLGQHTQLNYVGRGIASLPSDNTNGHTMSSVSCYHRPWIEHIVGLRGPWQVVFALRQYTQGRTMLVLACHRRPWKAYMVGQCQAWHIIIVIV